MCFKTIKLILEKEVFDFFNFLCVCVCQTNKLFVGIRELLTPSSVNGSILAFIMKRTLNIRTERQTHVYSSILMEAQEEQSQRSSFELAFRHWVCMPFDIKIEKFNYVLLNSFPRE